MNKNPFIISMEDLKKITMNYINCSKGNSSNKNGSKINNPVKIKSYFNLTAEDIKTATERFITEGSKSSASNKKGVVGIALLKNRYHIAKINAIATVMKYKK